MNKTVKILALAALALVAILVVLDQSEKDPDTGQSFLPGFREQVESVSSITVIGADSEQPVEIKKAENQWIVPSRSNFPANNAMVREVLLAMVDAKIREIKTANPDQFHLLGLRDPGIDGSKGIKITVRGNEFSRSVIIGNLARGNTRYARLADGDQSWLIDQNPDVPEDASDWLLKEVLDISNADISAISIAHPDGETIEISRNADEASNFDIDNIPDGRELSYATVANGIAGALSDLTFDDVREVRGFENSITTTFQTTDGMVLIAHSVVEDDDTWVSFIAQDSADTSDRQTEINSRVSRWQYKLPAYKSGLLARTWDDLLKEPNSDE